MGASFLNPHLELQPATMAKGQQQQKKVTLKFVVDCSTPVEHNIFDIESYSKYLIDHIKVGGKTNNLGEIVKVTRDEQQRVTVTSTTPMSKGYVKYLTKRFLKKSQLRDWLRVVASDKASYKLKYFNVNDDNDDDDDEDEEESDDDE